jgi:hypothetical protein
MQISKNIPLFTESTTRNITDHCYVAYYYQTGPTIYGYSFNSGSDVRNLAFSTILAVTEFSQMATVYKNYRILKAAVTLANCLNFSKANGTHFPILYFDLQPSIAAANPTNSDVVDSDSARLFTPYSTRMEDCTWSMPGPGISTNLWYDTSAPSNLGQFVIGTNADANLENASIDIVFDVKIDLVVQFTNPK